MRSRSLTLSFALILATIFAGLAVRFAPLHLPAGIAKYGGSMLWALMLYWIVSAFLPSLRISAVAVFTGTLGTAVEFFKFFHSPALDAFRLSLPGILLLGRFFSGWDILAYWVAILAGAALDQALRTRGAP